MLALGSLGAAFAPDAALASTTIDVRGAWPSTGAFAQTNTITSENFETGEFSGRGVGENGSGYTWPDHGTITGNHIVWVFGPYDQVPSYTATCEGTVSPDGSTVEGECHDTTHGSLGAWKATRSGGSPGEAEKKEKEEREKKEKEEAEKAKRRAAIQVNCSAFEVDAFSEYFQCTAQLGDASGRSPADTPTGSVTFKLAAHAVGLIEGSGTCTLVPSQTGGASSFCAVNYRPPLPGAVPIGTQPPITATYSGDGNFNSASAKPSGAPAAEAPSEAETLKALCGVAFMPGCEAGTLPKGLKEVCVALGACGAGASGGGAGGETVTVTPTELALVGEAKCPAGYEPITECELKVYLESENPDPKLKEKAQQEKAYNSYINTLNVERAAVLRSIQSAAQDLSEADGKYNAQTFDALSILLTKQINERFDEAAIRGQNSAHPTAMPDTWCEGNPNCLQFVKDVNNAVNNTIQELLDRKVKSGLAPKGDAPKATGSSYRDARVARRTSAGHRVYPVVLAESAVVKIRAGQRARIRMPLNSLARAELAYALRRRIHALRGHLVVFVGSPKTGAHTVRTVNVTLHIVARKPAKRRHGHR